MPAASTAHPTDTAIRAFVLGKLPDAEEAAVEHHLAACPACLARAAAARPDDTLLSLVAAVGTRVEGGRTAAHGADPTPAEFTRTREWDGRAAGPGGGDARPPEGLLRHPRYRPVRPLGQGGMGVVWLAEHTVMHRPVALKLIHPTLLDRPGAVGRFRREVRAVARLSHPNIVPAFDADEAGGVHFLVTEYVPGETLLEAVRRGPLAAAEACRAVRDAARGLAAAHAAGLVHRDVKPGNLIRAADGTVMVLDFGLVGAAAGGTGLTGEGVTMGTPDYVAPEQADDPAAADARSDVYALGCTLYHLLAGRVPYPGRSVLRKLDAHRDPAVSPDPVPGLPPGLAAVLAKMTATEPSARYPSAEAVADALTPYCDGAGPPAAAPAGRRTRRRVWVAVAAAGLVLAAAAAGVVYTIHRENAVVTVEADDPDVEVVMRRNGELVRVTDGKTKRTWELDTTRMRLTPDGGELSLDLPDGAAVVLRRNGAAVATVRRAPAAGAAAVPAPPAAAPAAPPLLRPERVFAGHAKAARQTAFAPDGKTLYSCGGDGFVRGWDLATGREVTALDHGGRVIAFALADGGKTLVSVTSPVDGPSRLWAWDLSTGKETAAFPRVPAGDKLSDVALSPDGARVATISLDGTGRVWDLAGRALVRTWKAADDPPVYRIVWSPDGRLLAVVSWSLTVSDAGTGRRVANTGRPGDGMTWAAFSADGARLYEAGWDGVVRVYDTTRWAVTRTLATKETQPAAGTHAALAPGGRMVLAAHTADVRVWDVGTDRLLYRLVGDGLDSLGPAVSPDGKRVAAGSEDGKVRVWLLP